MALTLTLIRQTVVGPLRVRVHDVDFDDSYPTGGEALTAADLGVNEVYAVIPESKAGYVAHYDRANEKLLVYQSVDPADAGGADTPLVEVADTTDLNPGLQDLRIVTIGV